MKVVPGKIVDRYFQFHCTPMRRFCFCFVSHGDFKFYLKLENKKIRNEMVIYSEQKRVFRPQIEFLVLQIVIVKLFVQQNIYL